MDDREMDARFTLLQNRVDEIGIVVSNIEAIMQQFWGDLQGEITEKNIKTDKKKKVKIEKKDEE